MQDMYKTAIKRRTHTHTQRMLRLILGCAQTETETETETDRQTHRDARMHALKHTQTHTHEVFCN